MIMNPMLAAGLFDSPWIVAAIIIVGAFINWLSQLRQQKQQREEEQRAREAEGNSPAKPKADFDVEEALRRLLGEEAPPPIPAPPPILRPASVPPPVPPVPQGRVVTPVLVSRPVTVVRSAGDALELAVVDKQAAARLAQAGDQVRQHLARPERGRRVGASQWSGLWRDRAGVRRAFVGSLVFGPPKGLES